ncbi:WD40-repeat-containing domain protein, partial [Amylostereum chailletii]
MSSYYPHTLFFPGKRHTVVISGPHIQVLDSTTGAVVSSTLSLDDTSKEKVLKSGPVRCAAVNRDQSHLVTVGEDKRMKVWLVDELKVLNERELPKKPTQILFTQDSQTILVADKFGDVFSYPLNAPETPGDLTESAERYTLASHENSSGGTLILGHTSLLTSVLLTMDERYIVTSDRDEHIRVSWYPQGYCIESYCLGHTKFVSAIHIPIFAPSLLLSGGGDSSLRKWDWLSGKPLGEIPILDSVQPFIKVLPQKRKRGEDDEGDGEAGAEGDDKKSRKSHGRKGRGKNKKAEDANVDEGGSGSSEPQVGEAVVQVAATEDVSTLVLQKLHAIEMDKKQWAVFSAIGATALFWVPLDATTADTVHAHDFGKPVIGFTPADNDGKPGLYWVMLDADWTDGNATSGPTTSAQAIRLVQLSSESASEVTPPAAQLLSSLNTQCLIPASVEARAGLDLYSDLTNMPKNVDVAHNPMVR